MRKKLTTLLRHRRLTRVAATVVDESNRYPITRPIEAAPVRVIALAYTRHQMTVDADEAQRYVDGALVDGGKPLHQPTT
jgi:hypothetical protein